MSCKIMCGQWTGTFRSEFDHGTNNNIIICTCVRTFRQLQSLIRMPELISLSEIFIFEYFVNFVLIIVSGTNNNKKKCEEITKTWQGQIWFAQEHPGDFHAFVIFSVSIPFELRYLLSLSHCFLRCLLIFRPRLALLLTYYVGHEIKHFEWNRN